MIPPSNTLVSEVFPQEEVLGLVDTDLKSAKGPKVKPVMLSRWEGFWVMSRIRWHLFVLILGQVQHPIKAIKAMRALIKTRRKYLGDSAFFKVAKVSGRYYFEYNTPGWPSQAFDDYHLAELNRVFPFQNKPFA